jgi:prevent-host-death family protein
MRDTYSLYEAKAHLSAIIRRVRDGQPVTITVRGEPVAEIRAVAPPSEGLAARLDALSERGVLVRKREAGSRPRLVTRRPGSLKRFLEDRDG